MGKDRDEKFEGHEESEYHFSDEEVSYEVEPEAPSKTTEYHSGEPKESLLTRITQSKRILASIGVFLVLVFIVYKMVAPSSVPSTEIANTPAVAQQNAMPKNPVVQQAQNPSPTAPQMTAPVVPPIPGAMAQSTNQPAPPAQAAPTAMPSAPAQAGPAQVPPAATAALPPSGTTLPPAAPAALPPSGAALVTAQQPTAAPPTQMPAAPTPQQTIATAQPASQQNPVATMPAVIPIEAPVPTSIVNQPAPGTTTVVETKTAALTADTEKMMDQFQAAYAQKFNDYANQNKALQDQVQALNARVANMENQLNQLVQVLTRQQGLSSNNSAPVIATASSAELPKMAYNVQAIIPGRAWLKSENGETLTVAEGDVIKNLGRVTKIDPYDGVVEINTGSKAISLSYGNGG